MNQIINTFYWKIIIRTNLNLDDIKYFIYTFLPYWENNKILYKIKHIHSNKTKIDFFWKNIIIYDNWSDWVPKSFIIFLNHLLSKKNI